jgi:hypothetical protein
MRRARTRWLAAALALLACSKHEAATARKPSADSAVRAKAEENRAVETDEWNRAEVVKRLGEAGLVVTDSNRVVHHPGIDVPGTILNVSGSTLELYLYPTTAARKQSSAKLDTMPNRSTPPAQRPRYIISGNLVAIHVTPKEALAERVENVLTARHAGAP